MAWPAIGPTRPGVPCLVLVWPAACVFAAALHVCVHAVGVCGADRRLARPPTLRPPQVHGEHKLAEVTEVMRKERDTRSLVGLFGGDKAAAADGAAAAAEAK